LEKGDDHIVCWPSLRESVRFRQLKQEAASKLLKDKLEKLEMEIKERDGIRFNRSNINRYGMRLLGDDFPERVGILFPLELS